MLVRQVSVFKAVKEFVDISLKIRLTSAQIDFLRFWNAQAIDYKQ